MKKNGIILLSLLSLLILLLILSISTVKRTSFYNENYYKETIARADSIKSTNRITNDSIQAGFAKISITPQIGKPENNVSPDNFQNIPLAGYGARKGKPATGVHDSIYIKAVALKTTDRMLVFIAADLLIMPPNIADSVVKYLARSGLKREQLVFSATHSHSSLGGWGPGFIGKQFAGEESLILQKWIAARIVAVVTSAIKDLRPALIGTGSFNAEAFTRNRTIGESGTKNNDFSYILFWQRGGRKAIIGSFAAHATNLGDDNMQISAEYPGYWAGKMEEGSADIALFFAGSTGSQSPVSRGEGFEKARFMGESLADSLIIRLKDIKMEYKPLFSSVSLKIELPGYHIRLTPKINLSGFWSKKLMPEPQNVYLQAVRLGKMVWITTPCDFSGEYALQLKNALASAGFDSNVSGFNGSYLGYIMPGKYFYFRDYESTVMGWFGPEMGDYTMELIRRISRTVTGCDNI